MDEFNYLIKEAETKFFESLTKEASSRSISVKKYEEVADYEVKTASMATPLPEPELSFDVDFSDLNPFWKEDGIKLAQLINKSNQNGLQKEASETLFSDDHNSYQKMASLVAASSGWESFGMTKTAMEYLDALEQGGVVGDEFLKMADKLAMDALATDVTVEAILEKQAGAEESLEELQEELMKLAWGAVGMNVLRRAGGGILKRIGSGIAGAAGATKTLGQQAARKVVSADTAARGFLKKRVAPGLRRVHETRIRPGLGMAKAKMRPGSIWQGTKKTVGDALGAPKKVWEATGRGRAKMRGLFESAKSGISGAVSKGSGSTAAKLEGRSAALKKQYEAGDAATKARLAPEIKTLDRQAASRRASEAKWKERAEKPGKLKPEEQATGGVSTKGAKDAETAVTKAETQVGKTPVPETPPANTEALLKQKATENPSTFGEIYNKWSSGGWKALSDQEKRKVYLGAGGAFVAQRALMDRPIV